LNEIDQLKQVKSVSGILCVSDVTAPSAAPALLDWSTVHRMMPWNIILLLGGGFALADGCKVSSHYSRCRNLRCV